MVAAIVVAISIGVTCLGGIMGVAVTDMIFFFLMVTCVSSAFPKLFFDVGGLEGIKAALSGRLRRCSRPLEESQFRRLQF